MNVKITGTGCYIPSEVETNQDFLQHEFLNEDGSPFKQSTDIIIKKFKSITGIDKRRYAEDVSYTHLTLPTKRIV